MWVQVVKPKFERTKDSDEHTGWVFAASNDEEPGAETDPLNGAKSIRDLYELVSENYSGRYTVPVCFIFLACLLLIVVYVAFGIFWLILCCLTGFVG